MTEELQKKYYEYEIEESKMPRKRKPKIKDFDIVDNEPDKYYKKFDFFYKRTCFRLMVEFYKLLFGPYQKKWLELRKKSDMNNYILAFAH